MISEEIRKSLIIFIASGALSFVSAPLFSRLLLPVAHKIGAIDRAKDDRRMHKEPVARIGGVAIFAAFALGAWAFLSFCAPLFSESTKSTAAALICGGLIIVVGGLADDIYTLSPAQKMFYQVLAALVVFLFGARAPLPDLLRRALPSFFQSAAQIFFTIFWCVLITNSFNLIDGLDGLCASSAAFCILALFAMSGGEELTAIYLLSALLGFLPLNLRPAKLFLGDAGAMLLGLSLATLSLKALEESPSFNSYLAVLTVFAIPLFDTVFAAARRILNGKSPFSPDRKHLHHRLVDAGISHARASLFLSLLTGGFCALGTLVYILGFSAVAIISLVLLIFPTASVIIMTVKKEPKKENRKNEKG